MIGLPLRSVVWWNRSKVEGWTLDGATLRTLAEDIEREIAAHEKVAGGIKHKAGRVEFDAVFATDLAEARTALAEIQAARRA